MRCLPAVLSLIVLSTAAFAAAPELDAPKPFGATPSPRQWKWHDLEFYGFLHFGVNTFNDIEWGSGAEKESVFNPTAFD